MTRYDDVDYWDNRYSSETEPFEWYQSYSGIRHFFTPKYLCPASFPEVISPSDDAKPSANEFPHANRVLILGCGNSELGQNMLMDGFKHICNVDFSSVVINQMTKKYNNEWYRDLRKRLREEGRSKDEKSSPNLKHSSRTRLSKISQESPDRSVVRKKQSETMPGENKMEFKCLNITKKLELPDESFDLIVCKGTLDALLCNQNASVKVQSTLSECHRLLDDNHGVMVVISYGCPEDRLDCFDNALWKEVKSYTVPKPMVPGMTEVGAEHYVYILFKRGS